MVIIAIVNSRKWKKRIITWSESKTQLLVAVVLLLLLPLLGSMQYRLLRKVSEAERERMRSSLEASANRFSFEFDQEVTRIYASFLGAEAVLGVEAVAKRVEGEGDAYDAMVGAAYSRWHESATYPRMIEAVYRAQWRSGSVPDLGRLDPETGMIEDCEWPAEMAGLRELLSQRDALFGQRREGRDGGDGARRLSPVASLAGKPALLLQIVDTPPGPPVPGDRQSEGPRGLVILALDLRYLQQDLLPSLQGHHFVESDRHNYDMAIVAATSESNTISEAKAAPGGEVWYRTATDSGSARGAWEYAQSDLSLRLLRLRPEVLRQQMRRPRSTSDRAPTLTPRGSPNITLAAVRTPRLAPINARGIYSEELQGIWDLHLRHHAGSLDLAVGAVRRTNLFISFAILLVLAASVLLVMISSMRARRLAQEQMNFVAGISHELRTPLAVIDSAGYNLSRGVVRQSEATREYGEMIRTECRRLGEMIEQVLDFATLRSGRQRFEHHPILLTAVMEEALRASSPLLDEGGFEVEVELPQESPSGGEAVLPEVMGDRQAIIRAIRNLLSNAMKYGGPDRWIGLRIQVTRRGKQETVSLTVSDHGRGIAREDLSRIFEPFYRSRDARSAQIQGNGLGLSLVKNIVEAHHGTIHVESQPGRGSSFTISLPAVMPEPVPESAPDSVSIIAESGARSR